MAVVLCLSMATTLPLLPHGAASGHGDDDDADTEEWVVSRADAEIPMAVYRASSVWTGEKAYIFSGRVAEGPVDTIMEFDPSTGKTTVMDSVVPSSRIMSTAAWVPPYAYIFGGQNYSRILDEVLRYEPSTDTIERMPYSLPGPRMGASAVALDGFIYLMGGRNVTQHVDSVHRFDPVDGTFEELPALPEAGGGRGAVTDGDRIYLFGGCGCGPNETVYEMDPATGESRVLPLGTGYGYYWGTAVWTGGSALVMGGNDFRKTIDHLYEFTPEGSWQGRLERMDSLPKPLELAVSFYDEGNDRAYLLGGRSTEDPSDKIFIVHRKTGDGELDPGRLALVVSLMIFTIGIVLFQSRSEMFRERAPSGKGKRKLEGRIEGEVRYDRKRSSIGPGTIGGGKDNRGGAHGGSKARKGRGKEKGNERPSGSEGGRGNG